MDKQHIIYEDIRKKEQELEEMGLHFQQHLRKIDREEEEVTSRRRILERMMQVEEEKLYHSLKRFSHDGCQLDDFHALIRQLHRESEDIFHKKMGQLEQERENATQSFRRNQMVLESELTEIRRQYDASTDE
ncbi:hypothetical protein [Streptococcus gallinaceus]|uniref:Cingulin n=1 Tax=Streptococcus gallinaceus TaxID=165758 RepID=A0ABV2JJ58_9STRE